LPALARFRGIRFVDTPGLESVLSHNTDASLEWLPNAGLAIVAVPTSKTCRMSGALPARNAAMAAVIDSS